MPHTANSSHPSPKHWRLMLDAQESAIRRLLSADLSHMQLKDLEQMLDLWRHEVRRAREALEQK